MVSTLSVTTKISEESLIVNLIPNMGTVLQSELCAILTQRIRINIIHTIVFYQDAIVTVSIRVTYHGLNLSLGTMIVPFVVAPKSTFIYITIQKDWFLRQYLSP